MPTKTSKSAVLIFQSEKGTSSFDAIAENQRHYFLQSWSVTIAQLESSVLSSSTMGYHLSDQVPTTSKIWQIFPEIESAVLEFVAHLYFNNVLLAHLLVPVCATLSRDKRINCPF